jgi:glycosyltransferase involved in cell wall biosynthesis
MIATGASTASFETAPARTIWDTERPRRRTARLTSSRHDLSVSVVVPVFERVDYLVDALRSVEDQTCPPEELIIVVDGPVVDLDAVLDAAGNRARVLNRPRGGPGAARNTGCAAATGTVLAFLDSDDLWLPTKLEQQLSMFADNADLEVVFTGVEQFYSPELRRPDAPLRVQDAERSGLLPSAMAVRAASFWRVGEFPEGVTFGELLDWYGRAADLGLRIGTVDEILVRRRVHKRNAGIRFRSARGDYADMVKALLDRRRVGGGTGAASEDRGGVLDE